MKVVLTQDVKDLGKAGQVVNVAEGHGRNFLIPRKLAIPADAGALKVIEQKRKTELVKGEMLVAEAKQVAEKLRDLKVVLTGKTGQGTKLYGSITTQEIADALLKQHHIKVDKRKIHVNEPIKTLGAFEVPIKLHHEVTTNIHVEVIAKEG